MSWRAPLRRAAVVLVPLLVVLGANGLRNYLASGEPILISSHGGLNFYIGNNSDAVGIYHPVPGVAASIGGQVRDATRVAEAAEGRTLSRAEVSSYFYRRAWEWMAAHPAQALKLFARKVAILLNAADVPLNYSYAFYSRDESTFLRLLVVGPMLLLPLGLLGLFVGARRDPVCVTGSDSPGDSRLAYWTWASFIPVYGLSVAAFFVSDRYRMPLLIPLAVLAALAIVWFGGRIRQRQFGPIAVAVAGLALAVIVVTWDLRLDDGRGGERARKAVWLIEQGSYDQARQYAAGAADGLRHPGVFHFQVGEALSRARRYEEAIGELRAALAIDRGEPAIQLALGQALLLAGRPEEALAPLNEAVHAAFRPEVSGPWLIRALAAAGRSEEAVRAIASQPDAVVETAAADTQIELGTLALERQAPAAAQRWLRAAAARAPDSAEAQEKLAVALLLQGRADEALAPIERACRLAPSNASARLNLAVVYAQLGRFGDARAAAREAVRLDSSEPRALALLDALSRNRR
jgi:tetratricopeptide (TPR) repeat protein